MNFALKMMDFVFKMMNCGNVWRLFLPGDTYSYSLATERKRRVTERAELHAQASAIRREAAEMEELARNAWKMNRGRGLEEEMVGMRRTVVPVPVPEPEAEPEPEPQQGSKILGFPEDLFHGLPRFGQRAGAQSPRPPKADEQGVADRREVLALLTAAMKQREGRMRRVLGAWVARSRAMRDATRTLKNRLERMDSHRLERSFGWWAEIWSAGDKGRHRRNLQANQAKGGPSPEKLKRQRARQWEQWEKQNARVEAARAIRKDQEWRAAKRERLLGTQRARTAELGAARSTAVNRSASQQQEGAQLWAEEMKKMAETLENTKSIEEREMMKLLAREAARATRKEAEAAEAARKKGELEQLVEDTAIWLRVVTTPQQHARRSRAKVTKDEIYLSKTPAQMREQRLEELKSKIFLKNTQQRQKQTLARRRKLERLQEEKALREKGYAEEEQRLMTLVSDFVFKMMNFVSK